MSSLAAKKLIHNALVLQENSDREHNHLLELKTHLIPIVSFTWAEMKWRLKLKSSKGSIQ